MGFPGGTSSKEPAGERDIIDAVLIPGLERVPGRHGNLFQYSCIEIPMNRGAQQATVHRVAKSWT